MTKRSLAYLTGAALCFIAAIFLLVQAGLPERAEDTASINAEGNRVAPEVGFLAPSFTARSVSGDTITLDDLRGQTVILNFWATWCGPCRVEMPELQQLYDLHENDGLRIVAVNLAETEADVLAWRDTFDLTFELVLDPEQTLARRYAFRDPPSTFIIAPDGSISHIFFGPVSEEHLRTAINQFLPEV